MSELELTRYKDVKSRIAELVENKEKCLVIMCFIHTFNAPSINTAKHLLSVAQKRDLSIMEVYIVDAEEESLEESDMEVDSTPTTFFYATDSPMEIQRSGWTTDTKLVGPFSEQEWSDIVQEAYYLWTEGKTSFTVT